MAENRITVERTINAPSAEIFEVLTNPERHVEIDGSGFIRSDEKSDRIQQAGDVFTMHMEGDHMGGEYRTENHVVGYDENRLLAWRTAPAGQEPPGWQWAWELLPKGSDSTRVRLTYDWDTVTDQDLLDQVGFPLVKEDQLEDSLVRLDEAVGGS
jgi:uncharacterized protein YndB with AHSA1/START domain